MHTFSDNDTHDSFTYREQNSGSTLNGHKQVTVTVKCHVDIKTVKKDDERETSPGGPVVKNPPANAGDTGSIPGPGRSHMSQSS